MSDEAEQAPDSVLRPFEPAEIEPLPPVQASSVVVPELEPEPTEPPAPAEAAASETVDAATDAPATEMVDVAAEPVPTDVPANRSEPWSPAAEGSEDVWFGLEEAVEDSPPPPPAKAESTDDAAAPVDDETEGAPAAAGDEPAGLADAAPAGVLPTASQNSEEITLPRNAFLIGVGVAAVAILALFALWQSAGGDDGPTATETPVTDAEPAEVATDDDSPAVDDAAIDDAVAAANAEADARIAGLETTVTDQETAIAGLQAELAAVPPPALRGDEMRRIVVAADASFVSVGSESVAVIGPFGGYAAIDPATNAVTAAGQVASGATRVLRTSAAVWITNYADSEIVRIDPTTSTVVASLEFPGPDGVAKLGGSLAVASFDGGFVAQVDPAAEAISRQVDVGGQPTDVFVTEDETSIWVALFDTGEIVHIDAATFEVTTRITIGSGPVGLDAADGVLWVVNHAEGTVVGVDLATESVIANYPVGAGPTAATVFDGSLWVTVTDAGELVQLDPATGETITRTPLGTSNRGGPTGLAVGNGSLWVAMQGERSVVRVTPAEG